MTHSNQDWSAQCHISHILDKSYLKLILKRNASKILYLRASFLSPVVLSSSGQHQMDTPCLPYWLSIKILSSMNYSSFLSAKLSSCIGNYTSLLTFLINTQPFMMPTIQADDSVVNARGTKHGIQPGLVKPSPRHWNGQLTFKCFQCLS